jgi:hypothetical protein
MPSDKVDIIALAAAAQAKGYNVPSRLVERLGQTIVHNQAYLARRAARGARTSTDIRMEEDNEVLAMAIVLLDSIQ